MMTRALTLADVARCVQIEQASSDYPWQAAIFQRSLRLQHWAFGVISEDAQLVAFCICQCVADECSVLNLAVDPLWQRQGLARMLLCQGLAWGQARGAQHAFLEVRQSNQAAQALYAVVGFALVGLRENYYPVKAAGRRRQEHALVMAIDLSTGQSLTE